MILSVEFSSTNILLAERFKKKRMFEYGGGFVQDRSVYEDVDIFAKMHEEQGTMSRKIFTRIQNYLTLW